MTRGEFLQSVLAAAAVTLGYKPATTAEAKPEPVRTGELYTVRVGDARAVLVDEVYLDGKSMKDVTAFNVYEGWVEALDEIPGTRGWVERRHFGRVSIKWKM